MLRTELKSLRARLLFLLSFTLLPIAIIALANAYLGYEHYRTQLTTGAVAEGEEALRREEAIIGQAQNVLGAIAALPPDPAMSSCGDGLRRLLAQYSEFTNIAMLAPDGSLRCSALEGQGAIAAPAPLWFKDALNGRPFSVSAPRDDGGAAEPSFIAAAPLIENTNHVKTVLTVTIRLSALERVMRDFNLPEGGAMAVLDHSGHPLAQRSNQAPAENWLPPAFLDKGPNATKSGIFDAYGSDGVERRYVLLPLAGDLFSVFGMPVASIGDPAYFLLYSNIGSALLMWIAALVTTALAVGYFVTRPLHRIRRGMAAYTAGDSRARIIDTEDLPGEVRELAATFNDMADTIATRDESLREAVSHQKALTREVHHRVRNNLQIINSLMNLQSWRAETAAEIATFTEVQRRVTALGLVHSAIYQGDDMRSVRLKALLTDLCAATEQAMSDIDPMPFFEADADEMSASADIAVPLAFLITEIIGEATLRRNGTPVPGHIRIELRKSGSGGILSVQGDKPLFEPTHSNAHPRRNGLNLLAGLVRQLGGLQQINAEGTGIQVTIPNISPVRH
jgi:two-component sensor histidine kinase